MMYLKPRGIEFKTAAEAAEVAKGIIDHGPAVQCYYRRIPGETAWKKEVVWVVQVPAPRNCSALIKHLKARYPRSDWTLYEIDEDGFEVDLQPSSSGRDPQQTALIPVRTS